MGNLFVLFLDYRDMIGLNIFWEHLFLLVGKWGTKRVFTLIVWVYT